MTAYRGVRYFPYIPPFPQSLEPGPFLYRCTDCSNVTRYESFPSGGPGPCSHCRASPLDQRRVKSAQACDSLPADLCGGPGREVDGVRYPSCLGCRYDDHAAPRPARSCRLGLPQLTWWDAAENRVVRPVASPCVDAFFARLPRPPRQFGPVVPALIPRPIYRCSRSGAVVRRPAFLYGPAECRCGGALVWIGGERVGPC